MIDREKVIKEFEHILNEARGDYLDFADITVDFGDEILGLLKEQEPRVLTREEMKNMIGESVYVEEPPNNADPRCGWAEVTEGCEPPEEGFNFPGGVDFNAESGWDTYDGDLYGLDKGCGWRAWNRRPTPEQMKAVKWE